jgi:hypothetical protein
MARMVTVHHRLSKCLLALPNGLYLTVGNFIDALSSFVVFNSFPDDGNYIKVFLNSVYVELGIGTVATVDAGRFQAEQLFHDVSALTEINNTVQLYIVARSVEHSTKDYQLFRGYDELQLTQIQAAVTHQEGGNGTKNQKGGLEGDGIVTSKQEQSYTDKEQESLADDILRPVGAKGDNPESSNCIAFHKPSDDNVFVPPDPMSLLPFQHCPVCRWRWYSPRHAGFSCHRFRHQTRQTVWLRPPECREPYKDHP